MKDLNLINFIAVLCCLIIIGTTARAQSTTFEYTGSVQTYVVPDGVPTIQIEVYGASGGDCPVGFGFGGLGGYVIADIPVTPGETLNIFVGGQGAAEGAGGYNGGGTGFTSPGGGGASDVRQGGVDLGNRIIVAGGGGGGAYETAWESGWGAGVGTADGGQGGGLSGTSGLAWQSECQAGTGGTQTTGGNLGGTLGIGGDGSDDSGDTGGGGGGYYGGGGGGECTGYNGAGGGGSGYTYPQAENVSHTVGLHSGNGMIVITALCTSLSASVSDTIVCAGQQVTLSATGMGNITWNNEVSNGLAFTPPIGTTTYIASSDLLGECGYSVDIVVNELPTVNAGADIAFCDLGLDTSLTASGTADTYTWNNGISDGVSFTPSLGSETYILTGEITATGCVNTDSVNIVVNELPTVNAGADIAFCDLGLDTSLTASGTANTYSWNNGISDGVSFTPSLGSETYVVTGGITATGCANTDSVNVTVYALPEIMLSATDEMISNDGTITLVITSGEAPFTFDWDNDGTGDNDDQQNLSGLPSGDYSVTMTDANGCSTTASIFVGSIVGIEELETSVNVYPNPTTGLINIEAQGAFLYELFNSLGQLVITDQANNKQVLDLTMYESGTYMIRIIGQETISIMQVVKR